MKKKLLSILLCAAMVVSMAACGSASDGGDDTTATDGAATESTDGAADAADSADPIANLIASTTGTVELQLWCSETEAYQSVMAELVEGFKAAYPDVDFNISIGAVSEAQAKDKVLEDVEAAADVFVFADDQLDQLVTAGALQELSATYTYVPADVDTEASLASATKDGKLYAYPFTSSNGYFLYYNSNILSEEDVASWEGIAAACEAAGQKFGLDFVDGGWYLYGFFAGAGCNLTMNEDRSNSCDWNSATGLAVAESIVNIASSEAFVNVDDADGMSMMAEGTLAAYVSGTWDSDSVAAAYGDGYAACKLPTFDVNGKATQMGSFSGSKLVGVNAYSDNVGWAMLLAEYISNEEAQVAVYEATGEGPANEAALASANSPALSALAAQAPYADIQIVGDKYWDPANALAVNLVNYDGSDLQQLLDDAVAGITQAVDAE